MMQDTKAPARSRIQLVFLRSSTVGVFVSAGDAAHLFVPYTFPALYHAPSSSQTPLMFFYRFLHPSLIMSIVVSPCLISHIAPLRFSIPFKFGLALF